MAVVSTGLSELGLRAEFFERLENTPHYWQDLTTRMQSTTAKEKYPWLGAAPMMRPWGNGRVAQGLNVSVNYTVENQTYEATMEVDRKELEDDQIAGISTRINEMAAGAQEHKDFLIEELLKNGESAGYVAYDGKCFFADDHQMADSGAQSNKLTYDATTADSPTRDEFRKALAQAIAAMVAFKNDKGLPMRIMPRTSGFSVIVPPTMMFTALEALALPLAPDASDPVLRNVLQNAAKVICFPGLTDASKFYLVKTDVPVRPFIFQDRIPLEFAALDRPDDPDNFMRGVLFYGVRARYAMAYGYWQYAISTDFT